MMVRGVPRGQCRKCLMIRPWRHHDHRTGGVAAHIGGRPAEYDIEHTPFAMGTDAKEIRWQSLSYVDYHLAGLTSLQHRGNGDVHPLHISEEGLHLRLH